MNGWELKQLIAENDEKIDALLAIESFVLNKEIMELINQNHSLRRSCIHEFENNICIYCSTKKENE